MREECKFFQARTYRTGEVARFCALDLAPEAPWRCPEDCPRFEKRLVDTAGGGGARVAIPLSPEPELDAGAVRLLSNAAEIISAAGPEIMAEEQRRRREAEDANRVWWRKLRRSPPWKR